MNRISEPILNEAFPNIIKQEKKVEVSSLETSQIRDEIKQASLQRQQKSFRVFKYLIVTTTVIFTFAGLGFGFALRFNDSLFFPSHNSDSKVNSNSLDNSHKAIL